MIGIGLSLWGGQRGAASARRLAVNFTDAVYKVDGVVVPQATVLALTRASAATYIDAVGVLQTAASDVVRFDWSDGTKALLVEPAATNLVPNSENFAAASWDQLFNITVATSATVDPRGGTGAYRLTATAASALLGDALTGVSGNPYTMSIWVRRVTGTGVINLLVGDATNIPITVTSDWVRVPVTRTPTSTVLRCYIRIATSGDAIEIFGAQMEDGSQMTSYIPTSGGAATRAADVASLQGLTALLDLAVTYGDGSTATLAGQPVSPGYWPALTETRIRHIIGTT